MFKRILIIGFFTGLGQIVSLFVIKNLHSYFTLPQIAAIAQIDSLVFFLINIIAMGLQSSAMRHIALNPDWENEFRNTQSARLALSFALFPLGFLFFYRWEYSVFFLTPLLALNGDYALYATGRSTWAAAIASIRIILPYIVLIFAGYFFPGKGIYLFVASWILIYFFTNWLVVKSLKVSNSIIPKWKNLELYLRSLPLGLVSVSFYFLGTGLILITAFFYPTNVQAVAFSGLKMYVIFKGVLRIIHQAFFKEMVHDEWCLRVDQLSILIALTYAGSFILFPKSFILLFFGKQNLDQQGFFLLLAIASIVYCFILSSATRSLLDKMDKQYSTISVVAAVGAILCSVVLSFLYTDAKSIGLSILLGEIILFFGLLHISKIKDTF